MLIEFLCRIFLAGTVFISAFSICPRLFGSEELFKDTSFSAGFRLSALDSRARPVEVGNVFAVEGKQPCWRLAQWGSNYSLEGAEERFEGNSRIIGNKGKLVELRKDGGDTVLRLDIRAGNDYGGKLRKPGEPWPHLLVEQYFDARPEICKLKNFVVSYEVRISEVRSAFNGKLDNSLHAAQLVMFFTLQDRNNGDYIWFGLPIYDSRSDFPSEHKAVDAGKSDATSKYIYAVDGKRLWRSKIRFGRWEKFNMDVLPLMKEALEDAFKKGWLKNSDLKDIVISTMNTGWEMPGPFNAIAEYKNLSAKYEKISAKR